MRIDDDGSLVLAMTNPLDVIAIDEVEHAHQEARRARHLHREPASTRRSSIYFSSRGKLKDAARGERRRATETTAMASTPASSRSSTALLTDAVSMDASDIHLEPREDTLHVRCRIDGVLHELREFPTELQAGILSRLKIMGNLDIAERRLPQDGRTTSSSRAARPSTCGSRRSPASTARTSPSASSRSPRCRRRSLRWA